MADYNIIGREYEQRTLQSICEETEAKLVAVFGRRRVGKTFLIKNFFKENFDFFFTGSFETPMKIQLALFAEALKKYSGVEQPVPKNWHEAFRQLEVYLATLRKKQIVVFLDELPWMDTPKSGFLTAFSYFWNSWASTCKGLKMIICGSATSWMLDKIIGDRGGLYGRCSRTIHVSPFSLYEVEQFLMKKKGIKWTRYQILEAYMIMGGIPYYLDMLEKGLPFAQNIDNLFYRDGAPLRTEYDFLFRSLFKSSTMYRQVVEALSKKNKGLTLKEIKEEINLGDGGVLSTVIDNLCKCGFIRAYSAYGKRGKGTIYQLIDLFCLYHQKFLGGQNVTDAHFWSNIKDGAKNAWAGYAFEMLCLHHIKQIRVKLGISGVLTNICSWSIKKQTDADGAEWDGAQIDLLLCRADNVIDVCEMKYCKSLYTVTAAYDEKIRERNGTFEHFTKTKDALHNVLITTYGVKRNMYADTFNNVVTADDLFKE